MKYCHQCGTQIPENVSFCPNCGAKTEEQNQGNTYQSSMPKPTLVYKDIAKYIILSILTCGIYGIVWFIGLVDDVNTVCQDDKSNQSGVIVFLLTIVTCGIYGLIWYYTAGIRLNKAGEKYNMTIADNSIMYLVIALFGLQIVNWCIIQSELNKFANQ